MAKFKRIALLDSGGQGKVWKAKIIGTDRHVALKYLSFEPGSSRDERSKQKIRFIREVKNQSTLDHSGIMPVLACATHSSPPWYAMPLADHSLQNLLNGSQQSLNWITSVMNEVMDAVQYSHEQGVIHRDLKPNNILSVEGRWVVSDFGYSRNLDSQSIVITEKEHFMGSFAYAAPEQYDDAHQATPAADIYSLTKILIHCLTWQIPYPYARVDTTPERLHSFLNAGLADNPSHRPQTVSEFRSELGKVLNP
ncbi:serine/threonine protein kinase [Streptomyces sp. CB03578]|uniref:serine/threonine protein kinase n=1 Tax=Streptomyces sp. CB03578 TaxID=1718987 RepID=UPI00093E8DD3|nr:serine/threonine-protein kinase [Streptomyces sp. CB03578]